MRDELGTYIDLPHTARTDHAADGSYGDMLRQDPCSYCGRPVQPGLRPNHGHSMTIDHIDALINGGRRGFSLNGTASCRQCNARKGHMKLIHWLNRIANQRDAKTRAESRRMNKGFFTPEQIAAMKKVCGE